MAVTATPLKQMKREDAEHIYRVIDRALATRYARQYLQPHPRRVLESNQPGRYKPRMDLCDSPDSPRLTATIELPGMKKDDLSIEVFNGCLTVSGTRRPPPLLASHPSAHSTPAPMDTDTPDSQSTPDSHANAGDTLTAPTTARSQSASVSPAPPTTRTRYPVQELKYGQFRRVIALPAGVKATEIAASMADGMLIISWPRVSSASLPPTRHIDVA